MNDILFVTLGENAIPAPEGYSAIQYSGIYADPELHQFVAEKIALTHAGKICILTSSLRVKDALRLAFHIRLVPPDTTIYCTAILIVSPTALQNVLDNMGTWASILHTPGVRYLSLPSDAELLSEAERIPALPERHYTKSFLKAVTIENTHINSHSLANEWGIKVLAEAAGISMQLERFEIVEKGLFFKWMAAVNGTLATKEGADNSQLLSHVWEAAKGKKILLVDDEADKGWADVLKAILVKPGSTTNLDVISEQVNNYKSLSPEAQAKITSGDYDLFLVDLRLGGMSEDDEINPDNFSGMAVLKRIKQSNPGKQVIVMSGSNRAHSVMAVLTGSLPADGYYLKESPNTMASSAKVKTATNSFLQLLTRCLNASFLKRVATEDLNWIDELQNRIDLIGEKEAADIAYNDDFVSRIDSALKQAFYLHYQSVSNPELRRHVFQIYHQILEEFTKHPDLIKTYEDGAEVYQEGKFVVFFENRKPKGFKIEFNGFRYFIASNGMHSKNDLPAQKLTALLSVSAILHYRCNQGNNRLKVWGELNSIRNKKCAHGAIGEEVTADEIARIRKLVGLVIKYF